MPVLPRNKGGKYGGTALLKPQSAPRAKTTFNKGKCVSRLTSSVQIVLFTVFSEVDIEIGSLRLFIRT